MGHEAPEPNPWMILPFGLLLGTIAMAPLVAPKWWQRHYPKVALALAAITLSYYLLGLHQWTRVLHGGEEYVSFIMLIGSLYVVSGGIHIGVRGEATPHVNTLFLLVGAVLANFLGTTGASMLLIRPWIRMNKYRITAHHVVFFIFVVSNVGGCLTPIGDPPLFLGYLKGIPFWWVAEHCWPMWALGVGLLLAMFYAVDLLNYRRAPKPVREQVAEAAEQWRVEGLWNLVFLLLILVAVFINHPLFLREGIMLAAALGSWFTTRKHIHEANHFDFHPIQEVAILFIGIFATMMPALDWLQNNAARLGTPNPGLFYWACGCLSSMLDNAPTYLSFLSAAFGLFVDPEIVTKVHALVQAHGAHLAELMGHQPGAIANTVAALEKYHPVASASGNVSTDQIETAFLLGNAHLNAYIVAISIGAVFFGAATYIGNGPNFMVKSIADRQNVPTPGFLGLVFKYSLPFLFPVLALTWLLFFRG